MTPDAIAVDRLYQYHIDFYWYCQLRIALARFLLLVLAQSTSTIAPDFQRKHRANMENLSSYIFALSVSFASFILALVCL